MESFGKILILAGLLTAGIGLLLVVFPKSGVNLFRLPGDIVFKKENFTFYFPIATSIVISIVLSGILWLFRK